MNIYNKRAVWIAVAVLAVLIVIAVAWKLTAKRGGEGKVVPASTESLQKDKDAEKDLQQTQTWQEKVLEGTLKASNNPKKGNLMLVTATTTLYIFTSRDYSSLQDKPVKVLYDGTPEDFRLGDIVEK